MFVFKLTYSNCAWLIMLVTFLNPSSQDFIPLQTSKRKLKASANLLCTVFGRTEAEQRFPAFLSKLNLILSPSWFLFIPPLFLKLFIFQKASHSLLHTDLWAWTFSLRSRQKLSPFAPKSLISRFQDNAREAASWTFPQFKSSLMRRGGSVNNTSESLICLPVYSAAASAWWIQSIFSQSKRNVDECDGGCHLHAATTWWHRLTAQLSRPVRISAVWIYLTQHLKHTLGP